MMTENAAKTNANRAFAIVAIAVVAVVAALLVLVNLTGNDMTTSPASQPTSAATAGSDSTASTPEATSASMQPGGSMLPERMSAARALTELSDEQFKAVADRNGKTVAELKDMLETNPSMMISQSGDIMAPGGAK